MSQPHSSGKPSQPSQADKPVRKGGHWSLVTRLFLVAAVPLLLAIGLLLVLLPLRPQQTWLVAMWVILITLPMLWLLLRKQLAPILALFRALGGTVISYRDGDYSFSLHWPRNDELAALVDAHNTLGDVLREQRLDLIQRELLLDTMLQNTPVALVLVAERRQIVFANIAARQLLSQGRKLEGYALAEILQYVAPALREAIDKGGDGLFSVKPNTSESIEEEEIYHLSRRQFHLNGRNHELLLLRHLTVELRRQEVQTWKKVIRVISHELNNSLAPVASLAHSAAELVRRGQTAKLPKILETIEERTRHLENFIHGYARFAKLPTPRKENILWPKLLASLQSQVNFTLNGSLPEEAMHCDIAQMEQALLNILKNAHEAGGAPEEVGFSVRKMHDAWRIDIMDRGTGMNEAVMANALVPFYSTKRSGTGLGLALTREIVEAHGGRITLNNRLGGGVTVSLILPCA